MTPKSGSHPVRLAWLLALLCPLAGFGQSAPPVVPEKLASVVPTTVLGAEYDRVVFEPVSRATVLARKEPPEGVHTTFQIGYDGDVGALAGAAVPSEFRLWVYDLADAHDEYVAAVLDWGHGMRSDNLFGFPALLRYPVDPEAIPASYSEVLIDGRFAVGAVLSATHTSDDILPPTDVVEVLKDLDLATLADALRTAAGRPDTDFLPDVPVPFSPEARFGRPFPPSFGSWSRVTSTGGGGALFREGGVYANPEGRRLHLDLHLFRHPPAQDLPDWVEDTTPPPERGYREFYWNWAQGSEPTAGSITGLDAPLYAAGDRDACTLSAWLFAGRLLAAASTDPATWTGSACDEAHPALLEALGSLDVAAIEAALGESR